MVCLIFYYFCSETWFAILFTVITEVCQPQVKSTLIAVFLFLMNNVGGNLPVVVTSGMVASAGIEKSVLNLFALWRNKGGSIIKWTASVKLENLMSILSLQRPNIYQINRNFMEISGNFS